MPQIAYEQLKTVKARAVAVLENALTPLALHEFPFLGTNTPSLSDCLRKMARKEGTVSSRRRPKPDGTLEMYTEWWLVGGQVEYDLYEQELILRRGVDKHESV